MRNLRKSFVTIAIVVLSSFFLTVIIAVNSFNSQIKYSNERNLIARQVYYNAYAGIQKGIFEIRQDKDCSVADYFSIGADQDTVSPKNEKYYTYYKVSNVPNGTIYTYTIESIGYGKFKETLIAQKITAKITVDYVEKTGIIRVDSMKVE